MYPPPAKNSIRTMTLSKPVKRFLAGVASAFLLLCQSAVAAQACALAPAVAGESALAEPCHHSIPRSGNAAGHAQQQNCPAQYASAGFAKLDVPQAADLPALEVQPGWLRASMHDGSKSIAPPARAEPPPLAILHCCLRI